ncbi:MAG TPA: ribosome-associated translation inhibitor RaiA [Acidimicrobiales bacterium]|nr:ribosome-associated translation inhibitor RaiA [Acidimicrobiales bacterium]
MEVAIRSRNTDVPDALRSCVEDKVGRLGRFLEGMERAEVRFSQERNPRIADREVCEVTMVGHGHIVRAKAAAADGFCALDRVVDKLEHRLGKLKGRLVGRAHPRRPGQGARAEAPPEEPEGPRIVKTKRFAMKPMSPEEAVLQMDLLGHDFFFFTNAESSRSAVVYRRADGDIGLIEAG